MDSIVEPSREIPVIGKADLCVIGGSATGVFAAIRAARLGLHVILIESQNRLGGTAVGGLVCIWHALTDLDGKVPVIAGLTAETAGRLRKTGDLVEKPENRESAINFNPSALAIELDRMAAEAGVRVMLHTAYASLVREGERLRAIFVETVEGRRAIEADFFIDASGDGRVARDFGVPHNAYSSFQPASACFQMIGSTKGIPIGDLVRKHGQEFGLEDDWGWSTFVAGCDNLFLRADTHVFGARCDKAEDLTRAEIEGRKQAAALVALLNKYGGRDYRFSIASLCSHIGVRETVHTESRFKATAMPLLTGKRYDDPIMNGTYRVDIHHANDMGITFRYLDGTETTTYGRDTRTERRNWREDAGLDGNYAKYYQVPFEIIVPPVGENLVAVGRCINADENAFGALRVMVNLNQIGEAAGVAAFVSLDRRLPIGNIDGKTVTALLRRGGSAL